MSEPFQSLSYLLPRRLARFVGEKRSTLVDFGVAGLVLLAVSIPFVLPVDSSDPEPTLLGYALGAGTAIPLVWRRRTPFLCALVVSAFTVALVLYDRPGQPMQYGGVVAIYTVANIGESWKRLTILGGWAIGVPLVGLLDGRTNPVGDAFAALTVISAYVLGTLARTRRQHVAVLEDRARRLERQNQLEAEHASLRERRRITRDMHDIIAHAVSVMVVQAEAAAAAAAAGRTVTPDELDAISDAGRDAMTQLRRTLLIIGDEIDGHAAQPGIDDVANVVDAVRRTGLQINLVTTGRPAVVSPDVDTAVYRIVQEALTNTVRHSGATTASVRLDWSDDVLNVSVVDDGRRPGNSIVGGQGLDGIRERAASCGGTATAGPRAAGGFEVSAALPLQRQEAGTP